MNIEFEKLLMVCYNNPYDDQICRNRENVTERCEEAHCPLKSEEKVCRWIMVSEDEDNGVWDWYKSECGSTSDHEQLFCDNCGGKVVVE